MCCADGLLVRWLVLAVGTAELWEGQGCFR